MKLLLLAAFCAVVYSRTVEDNNAWPWQIGKEYQYNFDSQTWSKFDTSAHVGSAFKAQFIVKVKDAGHLVAKLENPQYAQFHDVAKEGELPIDIKYEPYQGIDQVFEIFISNNRIKEISVPESLSIPHENFLKGLLGALQVDLSDADYVSDFTNNYNKELYQGLFKKYETDVTGECETLYTVAQPSVQWRSQIPNFMAVEEPIEITKTKNYRDCLKRAVYSFGVPEGVIWQGVAKDNDEKQFIKHTTSGYLLVGKQGPIYQSELTSNVFVSPMLFGKQKSRVFSEVKLLLTSVKESSSNWPMSEKMRVVKSLLYTNIDQQINSKSTDEDVAKVQALLQEIASLMLKPNDLPKSEFLSKFNILVYFISNLNSEQLSHLTSGIEIAKSSKNLTKRNMWLVYRDAVAQSGSVDAFREVKSWILTKKIENYAAAEVIATVAGALSTRTFELESEFFEFAFNPVVTEQKYLNTSAILAATKYVRLSNNSKFVADVVVPRFTIEMKQAIENDDSNKAQVYIKALGNLAHPEILKAFAPYIEGKISVSKFLRLQMVLNLKPLANDRDEKVRAVLFSILRNTAEDSDVRVAAVLNIFLAFPTPEMMELMAMLTTRDPSTEVRAVIATSIGFAAGLNDPRFAELAKAAQSVLSIVSMKKYGYRMSTDSLLDYYTSNDELASFKELSFIGSETSILPIYHRADLRFRSTSQTEEYLVSHSISDMGQFINRLLSPTLGPAAEANFKFTPKEIAEKLNIKPSSFAPLEGSYFVDNGYLQEFFTFTDKNEEFSLFVRDIYKYWLKLDMDNQIPTSYTKLGNQKEVLVTFPLISGQPFIFKYSESVAVITNFHGPNTAKPFIAQQEYELTYARNIDGNVGYWDVLGDFYATSGLINKLQFNMPLKLTVDYRNFLPASIKIELPEEDTTLIHYSVWPYTTLQNTKDFKAASENPNTKLIERKTKVVNAELQFGNEVGTVFLLQGYSYSNDYSFYSKLFESNWLTNIRNMLYQQDVALTKFELIYKAKDSVNKAVTFRLFMSKLINQKHTDPWGPPTPIEDLQPKSENRITEIVKRAAAGIPSAKVNLMDVSVNFAGSKPADYVFTAAVADSFVDNKLQAAFVLGGTRQFNGVFKMIKPKVQVLDFAKAIKKDITVSYEAYLKFGKETVHFTGIGERTKEFTEKLLNSPLAVQCLKDNSNNNFYQMPCHKMVIQAHTPDKFNATFNYEPRSTFSEVSTLFSNVFRMFYTYEKEIFVPMESAENTMEIEARMDYEKNTFDLSDKFSQGMFIFRNVQGEIYYPYGFSFYAPTNSWERSRNCFTNYQHMPYCAVDSSKVKTFSGRSYDYELTNCWHVLMVDEYNHYGQNYDLVMLAKKPGKNQAELYISYKDPSGKFLELEVKPDNVAARTNAAKVAEGALTSYSNELTELPFFEYYSIDDATVFDVNNGGLRVVYDKERVVVFTDNHRNSTRGLCGHSSMQISDDFLTPWGRVERPDYFGASYSLTTEGCDPKTEQLKEEAKTHAFEPVTKFTWIGY